MVTMNLILIEERDRVDATCVTITGARATHLLNVLRVTPGQAVRIGLLDGPFGIGTVEELGHNRVTMQCVFDTQLPSRPRVDVLLALPRPKVMRRLWAQLAAIGVGQIILTNASRVERDYFDTHIITEASYRPLLIEGLQQARDTRVPRVSIHKQFKVLVEDHLDDLFTRGLRIVAEPRRDKPLTAAVEEHAGERVLLAIGPEGGWNDFELSLLARHGFVAVSMGARTLRSDTACVALLAVVHDAVSRSGGRPT